MLKPTLAVKVASPIVTTTEEVCLFNTYKIEGTEVSRSVKVVAVEIILNLIPFNRLKSSVLLLIKEAAFVTDKST